MMLVHQILASKATTGVLTIAPGATITEAAGHLSARRIGSLVVSATGATVDGILSERDIVRELGKRGPVCMGDTVEQMMTRDIITCTPQDTAESVLEKMTAGHFRHMPVVQGDTLVGLITLGDVVKARLSQVSMEKAALEGMIMGY
jgi:CBS domain-containing protein